MLYWLGIISKGFLTWHNALIETPKLEEASLAISQGSVESVMSTRFLTSALEALILQECWFGPLEKLHDFSLNPNPKPSLNPKPQKS